MRKAAYRRKGLFRLWFQKDRSLTWQGNVAASARYGSKTAEMPRANISKHKQETVGRLAGKSSSF